jgi:hypothetical protein
LHTRRLTTGPSAVSGRQQLGAVADCRVGRKISVRPHLTPTVAWEKCQQRWTCDRRPPLRQPGSPFGLLQPLLSGFSRGKAEMSQRSQLAPSMISHVEDDASTGAHRGEGNLRTGLPGHGVRCAQEVGRGGTDGRSRRNAPRVHPPSDSIRASANRLVGDELSFCA